MLDEKWYQTPIEVLQNPQINAVHHAPTYLGWWETRHIEQWVTVPVSKWKI